MKIVHNIIKSISYSALCASMILFPTSCKETEEVKEEFAISADQFDFDSTGGSRDIKISASEEWTVESSVEWCLVTPANGNGSVNCELRVDTSYLYKKRDAVLTFHSGYETRQVKVNQYGFEKIINPEEPAYTVPDYKPYNESFVDVTINSNVDFEVEIPASASSWLSYSIEDAHVTSIPRPRKIRFNYAINNEPVERAVDVIIKPILEKDQTAESATVKITQSAAPLIVPSRAGDSLAVVMMARIMRASNDPSNSGKSMMNWEHIKLKEFPVENGKEGETELRITELNISIFDTNESLPYQVKFLTKLESLSVVGNTNGYIRSIDLKADICELTNLKHLMITGYGLVSLPEEMKNMKSLESIMFNGNYFDELPIDILKALPKLKHVSFSTCRRDGIKDLSLNKEEHIGLKGQLPREIFELDQLETLYLSYNYFEGNIPEMPIGSMPNLKDFKINLNFLTGQLPEWLLKHKYFGCWGPSIFIFNQEVGKDSNGDRPGLTNEPNRIPDCPLN